MSFFLIAPPVLRRAYVSRVFFPPPSGILIPGSLRLSNRAFPRSQKEFPFYASRPERTYSTPPPLQSIFPLCFSPIAGARFHALASVRSNGDAIHSPEPNFYQPKNVFFFFFLAPLPNSPMHVLTATTYLLLIILGNISPLGILTNVSIFFPPQSLFVSQINDVQLLF